MGGVILGARWCLGAPEFPMRSGVCVSLGLKWISIEKSMLKDFNEITGYQKLQITIFTDN